MGRSGSDRAGDLPALRGARPSPNIWHHPATYEIENRAVDPDGVIDATIARIMPWTGARVLDIGCGTGFHLPRFARTAASVIGVEPHRELAAAARRRVAAAGPLEAAVEIRAGVAENLPVADASIDLVVARYAYFFGPGCEPGLAELDRVLSRGGTACVVDLDGTRSTVGRWFAASWPRLDPMAVERFWTACGWQRDALTVRWSFASRADLEAVLRIEFPPQVAEKAIEAHLGVEVDCAINLWSRTY